MKKLIKTQLFRVILAIILGIGISAIVSGILITKAYTRLYKINLKSITAKSFGLPIYEITRNEHGVVGFANNTNMAIIGVVFSIIFIIVIEFIYFKISKKKMVDKNDEI